MRAFDHAIIPLSLLSARRRSRDIVRDIGCPMLLCSTLMISRPMSELPWLRSSTDIIRVHRGLLSLEGVAIVVGVLV